jgi:hypothetical protein
VTGILRKQSGIGLTVIDIAVDNRGTVDSESGALKFTRGGGRGNAASSSWIAAPGSYNQLAAGTFALGHGVNLVGELRSSPATSAGDIQGPSGTLNLPAGAFSLTDVGTTSHVARGVVGSATLGGVSPLAIGESLDTSPGATISVPELTIEQPAEMTALPGSGRSCVTNGVLRILGRLAVGDGHLCGRSGEEILICGPGSIMTLDSGQVEALDASAMKITVCPTGRIEKSSGGAATISLPIDNDGQVVADGPLHFTGGGVPTTDPFPPPTPIDCPFAPRLQAGA